MVSDADSLNLSGPEFSKEVMKKELAPLEVNGITAVTLGTGLWSVATLIMVLMRDQLQAAGRSNWIAIGVCGIILGLLGMGYTKRRAARIARENETN